MDKGSVEHWLSMLHHVAGETLAELKNLNEHHGAIINIETITITIIGGNMPLDLTGLKSALTADTTVQDEMDTVIDAIVAAYSSATSQAEIDSITTQLNANVTRQQLKTAAAKNLVVTPGGDGGVVTLTATWSGAQTATVGAAYQGSVTASGGTAPYSFTQDSGALPDGVAFAADGSVSGTPVTAGGFTFGGSVTDAAGASGQWSGSVSVS